MNKFSLFFCLNLTCLWDNYLACFQDGGWNYIVPQEGKSIDLENLKEQLKESLPDYMVPSAIMILDAFPLTPNEKIDRKALPAPDSSSQRGEIIKPRNEVEHAIAEVWKHEPGIADDIDWESLGPVVSEGHVLRHGSYSD